MLKLWHMMMQMGMEITKRSGIQLCQTRNSHLTKNNDKPGPDPVRSRNERTPSIVYGAKLAHVAVLPG